MVAFREEADFLEKSWSSQGTNQGDGRVDIEWDIEQLLKKQTTQIPVNFQKKPRSKPIKVTVVLLEWDNEQLKANLTGCEFERKLQKKALTSQEANHSSSQWSY